MVLDRIGKGVPRQALSLHNPTYNLPLRAGATAEAAFLATTTPPTPTRPALAPLLLYDLPSPASSGEQGEAEKHRDLPGAAPYNL